MRASVSPSTLSEKSPFHKPISPFISRRSEEEEEEDVASRFRGFPGPRSSVSQLRLFHPSATAAMETTEHGTPSVPPSSRAAHCGRFSALQI
ncbi:hypothetical protein AAFF_G00168060 [Aldrovandia affinis]|uniref:Uncharacterized protein n=1 Tax=Aldrovandia affinis TaxID=143900 RepID=A0AAD7RMC0_9TELE|nr:hypothetical protein AAFF_G00168060 [Aldrovandia affinis]